MVSMHTSKNPKKLDIFALILLPIFATTVSLALRTNLLISIALFFGLPSAWLSCRSQKNIPKSLIFSLIVSIPATIVIDGTAVLSQAWSISSSFAFRLLGIIPIEQFLWGFLFIYTVVMYYQHLYSKGGRELVNRRMGLLGCILFTLLSGFLIAFFTDRNLLNIEYMYFIGGVIIYLLPIAGTLKAFPNLISKFIKTQAYFAFLSLLFELVALRLDLWSFPGKYYIGQIDVFGRNLPFEELIFFPILGAVGVLAYYELFGNGKLQTPTKNNDLS